MLNVYCLVEGDARQKVNGRAAMYVGCALSAMHCFRAPLEDNDGETGELRAIKASLSFRA